ncbi:MAG: 3-phosphoshikimate 1-carboxyvinyltransferase [Chloroflexi bacterium]|nr:3-phosphoshikimate 1-carboxyvinyltransferase [Chloroflexota bacterium]MCL5275297.1 3-phosphoshikimate 1-carboxyvinyltransferase [Chloroflexota bacterium]
MEQVIFPPPALGGVLRVPGDRSITVRAVLLGAVADGVSVIRDRLDCDDTNAALDIMRALGVSIRAEGATNAVLRVDGVGLRGLRPSPAPLYCNASGTTMRLLAGLMAGQAFASTLDGSAQLRTRPMRRITEPLGLMGAAISGTGDCAPLHIQPAALHGIEYAMPVASAQVKSALLLAGLYADGAVIVHEGAPTRDHTERMMAAMGVDIAAHDLVVMMRPPRSLRPLDITVPADFSSAAFFLVAGLLHPRARIELRGVGLNPTRTGLLRALNAMGADIRIQNSVLQGGEPIGDLLPAPGALRGIEVSGDLAPLMIDEFPIFAVAATQARGTTVVRDAQELRVKESNRIDGLVAELRRMGARIESTADGFIVDGPARLHGAAVDAYGDHRMAMALSVAGLIAEGETTILGADCVSKTYPTFYNDLTSLIKTHE